VTTSPALEVQIWPIDRLVLYARNPRKNDAVVDRMCSSIREFGFKIPVLARSDGEVVDGHLRIKAARKLRIGEIPVILCDEWSEQQVKAFRLRVNRSVNWAQWDDELLALELQELSEADFDVSLTGFEDAELARLLAAGDAIEGLTDEDAVPEVPETPIARPGNLWELGIHKLLVADATDIKAVHRLMAGDAADLVFTDPPYNVAYEGYTEEKLTIVGDRMKPEQFHTFLATTFAAFWGKVVRRVRVRSHARTKLPEGYAGERHEATVGCLLDGTYLWEERPGPPPASADNGTHIIRVILVGAKDGKPDYSWPDEAHS